MTDNETADEPRVLRRAAPPPIPGLVHVWSNGAPAYRAFPLGSRSLQIGREASCAIALTSDPLASRRHAEASFDAATQQLVVRDDASRHGVYVDGERIAGQKRFSFRVNEHHVLRLGSSLFVAFGDARLYIDDASKRARLLDESENTIIGPMMEAVRANVRRAAKNDQALLIQGESGSGKERLARLFHTSGRRAHQPYEALNCANIERGFAESLLFGHARGAFTGADAAKIGAFERVDCGVLFLDEIAELPLDVQPKLLRTLEDGWVHPMGSEQRVRVDVKLVSASLAKLRARIAAGTFRQDLYFRLRGAEVAVPPLRKRLEEIPHLVELFRSRVAGAPPASAPFIEECLLHPWPGNVRQLAVAVAESAALAAELAEHDPEALIVNLPDSILADDRIDTTPAAEEAATSDEQTSAPPALPPLVPSTPAEIRDAQFAELVEQLGGNVAEASKREGIHVSTGYERLRRHRARAQRRSDD